MQTVKREYQMLRLENLQSTSVQAARIGRHFMMFGLYIYAGSSIFRHNSYGCLAQCVHSIVNVYMAAKSVFLSVRPVSILISKATKRI
jgi:hypothetical protein